MEKSSHISIDTVRLSATKEVETRYPNFGPNQKKGLISQLMLERADRTQLTIDLAIETLKSGVDAWYEISTKGKDQMGSLEKAKGLQLLLDSARGFTDKNIVISRLKKISENYRNLAEVGPSFQIDSINKTNIFETVLNFNKDEVLHAADNYETLSKLFESQTTFSISRKK